MKVVAWLLIAISMIYFLVLAAIIANHYITLGSFSGNTWIYGSRNLAASTTVGFLAILVGLGLLRAGK